MRGNAKPKLAAWVGARLQRLRGDGAIFAKLRFASGLFFRTLVFPRRRDGLA